MTLSARVIAVELGTTGSLLEVTANVFATDGSANFGEVTFHNVDATAASTNTSLAGLIVDFWNANMSPAVTAADVRLSGAFNT
jgi:hypothetical protein